MTHEPITCRQCGAVVEVARECYATPMCYACLPPPEPLPVRHVAIDGWEFNRDVNGWYAEKNGCQVCLSAAFPGLFNYSGNGSEHPTQAVIDKLRELGKR